MENLRQLNGTRIPQQFVQNIVYVFSLLSDILVCTHIHTHTHTPTHACVESCSILSCAAVSEAADKQYRYRLLGVWSSLGTGTGVGVGVG